MSRTSLLIHCDGSSFVDETGRVVSVVGAPAISSAQYAPLTGNATSGAFAAGTDLLSVPSHADFDFGGGDFTLECFLRVSSSGVNHGIINRRATNAVKGPFALYINITGNIQFLASFNGTTWGVSFASPSNISTATWYHIVITRRGDVWSMYQNGVLINSVTVAGTIMASTEPVRIGADSNGWGLNGYIDEIRVTKGMAMYNGAFTTPTDPFVYPDSATVTFSGKFAIASASAASFAPAYRQSTFTDASNSKSVCAFAGRVAVTAPAVLLMHMDGANGSTTFTDEVGKSVTRSGTSATISTAAAAPLTGNSASALFTGATGYLTTPNHADFAFGSGEFTIEMWVNPTDFATYRTLFSKRLTNAGLGPIQIMVRTDGYITLSTSANGTSGNLFLTASGAGTQLVAGTWSHVAVTRYGGNLYLFVNGILAASGALTTSLVVNTYAVLIGGDINAYYFKGKIDEVRVVKGEAKYLSSFAVPTFPFSSGSAATSFAIAAGSTATFASAGLVNSEFYIAGSSSVVPPGVLVNTSTAMLLHMDGANGSTSFIDECRNRVVRVGNPIISTDRGKYGTQSALFDGVSGLEIHGTGPSFNIGTGEFLFEAWIYPTSRVYGVIFSYGTCSLSVLSNGHLYAAYHFVGGSNKNVSLEGRQAIPLNAWTHVAFGADWYGTALYVNGVHVASYASTGGALYADWLNDWRISIGQNFVGYIDEARFTNGLQPYYSDFPIVDFSPPAPFRIPDSTSSAFFIYEGASAGFLAAPNDPGLTSFSVSSGSTVDIKAVGIRTVAREFNIDTGTTTHLDGWLLIGAESYFDIQTESDFWFKSPGMPVFDPAFDIDTGSIVNFASPPQPTTKTSRFSVASASAFAPRTQITRPSKFLVWEGTTFKAKGSQNIPYVFSIQGKSTTSFKGAARVDSRFDLLNGSSVRWVPRGSDFSMAGMSLFAFDARKLNGCAYAILTNTGLMFDGAFDYVAPPPVRDQPEDIFFRQRPHTVAVFTRPNSIYFREPA